MRNKEIGIHIGESKKVQRIAFLFFMSDLMTSYAQVEDPKDIDPWIYEHISNAIGEKGITSMIYTMVNLGADKKEVFGNLVNIRDNLIRGNRIDVYFKIK